MTFAFAFVLIKTGIYCEYADGMGIFNVQIFGLKMERDYGTFGQNDECNEN